MKTTPTDRDSLSSLELLKANCISVNLRKPINIAIITELVRGINYFKAVADSAGVKVLFEYCKSLELVHLSANIPLDSPDSYYIVYNGRIMCRNREAVIRDYTDGE